MKKIFYIIICISLINCSKKKNNLDYEKNVMIQVFPSIVDSIFKDWRTWKTPKPYLKKGISDSLKLEKLIRYKKSQLEQENIITEIEKGNDKIVLAVSDTIRTESLLESNEYIRDNGIEYLFDSITKKIEYKIDLSKFDDHKRIKFKYSSEFPQGRKIFKTKYSFPFGGVISFSRIQFDKNKNYGILSAAMVYDSLDGRGYRIYIKKTEKGKWIIDKIKETWIS